jgi:acyl-coenzyme A synthetase/AMP-(fatty) acid ligase
VVITADEGLRGGKTIPLKENVDEALRIAARARRKGDRRAPIPAPRSR